MSALTVIKLECRDPWPHPWWVDPDTGDVYRQDQWDGHPSQLVGFALLPQHPVIKEPHIDVSFPEFATDPSMAIGMYPVFWSVRNDRTCTWNFCLIAKVSRYHIHAMRGVDA